MPEEVDAQDVENIGKLLAIAAYAGSDHGRRLIQVIKTTSRLHYARDPASDPRCRTCRDSRGRPAPWPCVTSVLIEVAASADGTYGISDESIAYLRNVGREMNGLKPLPDGGLGREIAAYLSTPDLF